MEQVGVLLRLIDGPCDHQHDRVHRFQAVRGGERAYRFGFELEQARTVGELGPSVISVVAPANDYRRLHVPISDRRGQRVAVDYLLPWRPLVRSGGQTDQGVGLQITDRAREGRTVVGVVLVSEDDQIGLRDQLLVEGLAQRFTELVRAAALLGRRL